MVHIDDFGVFIDDAVATYKRTLSNLFQAAFAARPESVPVMARIAKMQRAISDDFLDCVLDLARSLTAAIALQPDWDLPGEVHETLDDLMFWIHKDEIESWAPATPET